ncbi:MAG: alpha/beta hydrolase [Rikenellaceae bacterium]|nr:alpha/beta hydrolase [Rikenellaceae bacterium]
MKLKVNGTELYYEVQGEGSPLLLLHGNGEDHTIFAPLAARLAAHYTVYSLDSRNHGRSARTTDISYEAMAGDMKGLVSALGLDRPAAVGFSDGAIIALMAQLDGPGLFSRMVLMGLNLSPADFVPEVFDELKRLYDERPDPLLGLMLTQPDIPLASLSGVEIPVLVVGAANDMFRQEVFIDVAATLPDSRLLIVDGHDHGSYILGNDMMYGPILEFLTE